MVTLIGWGLWWTVDDTLATTLGNPGIGEIPFWTSVLLGLCIHALAYNGGSSNG